MRGPSMADPRGLALAIFGACALATLGAVAACDTSVRVGELRALDGGPLTPDPDGGAFLKSWRLHGPSVPCSIYALVEARADDIWVGCNGGRIYRFDGVRARLAHTTEDENTIFSLLYVAADGGAWAVAQSGYNGAKATSSIHRFDGTTWTTVPAPKPTARVT